MSPAPLRTRLSPPPPLDGAEARFLEAELRPPQLDLAGVYPGRLLTKVRPEHEGRRVRLIRA